MYIMVKTHQKFAINLTENARELSILESRKHNQAVVSTNSGGLQIRSTPQRIDQCREAGLFTRGLRKSSSLTNGMSLAETKSGSESMALRPEVYICPATLSMRPSWALR
jgi:hypothetical protein